LAEDQHSLHDAWPYAITSGASIKEAFRAGAAWVEEHAEEVNALNVFPVPDGDTGTNMLLTCQAALEEMDRAEDTIPDVMRAIAHGSLMGARGNSGVILSQIVRGVSRSIDNKSALSVTDVVAALQEGSSTAYKGVIKPVEGTILTVIRETSEAAAAAGQKTDDIAALWDVITAEAHASVERTPSLLPALRLAGVVDAGGHGLALLLEGVQRHMRGQTTATSSMRRAALGKTEAPEEGYGYDIQFILHGDNLDVEAIRNHIAGMGESTLVVGDEHTIKVHTHAPNPGPVLQYGATCGSLSRVIIENMQQQYQAFREAGRTGGVHAQHRPVQELLAAQSTTAADLTGISTVVVTTGDGFAKLFKSLDCSVIVPGGQTMNPSVQQILAAIEAVQTDKVIILPNNKNIVMTAEAARRSSSKAVVVVPTTTVPQGIAALLALNYDADLEANKEAMSQAASRVRTAEITTAVRDSHSDGIDVHKGEIIGLVDDRLVTAGAEVRDVVMATLGKMWEDSFELLTFYFGNGVQLAHAEALVQRVQQAYPAAETEIVEGGQPHYMYIISAE
jgi:fatty acid kinase